MFMANLNYILLAKYFQQTIQLNFVFQTLIKKIQNIFIYFFFLYFKP